MNVFHNYTLSSLKKNKTRTLVTIIGIILSVAMFTATTEAFVTAQNYLVELTKATSGAHHVVLFDVSKEDTSTLTADKQIESFVCAENIGYAELDTENEYKPYIFISAVDENYPKIIPVNIIEGRMPQNSSELLVSVHANTNGGKNIKVGDVLTLEVGQREWTDITRGGADGEDWQKLTQTVMYQPQEETLINTKSMTYTVVGLCERPDNFMVEDITAPGYTAYTLKNPAVVSETENLYINLVTPSDAYKFVTGLSGYDGVSSEVNRDLLMYSLQLNDNAFASLFLGLAAILILLIIFGSVALIYNSFSISVSERTKQFGIFKSVGATKRQMRNSVLFEALILCGIAIPIGLISGCVGISVTFSLLSDTINRVLYTVADLEMKFVLSPAALIASSLLSIVTVIISAYIPAKKAIKITPIEAIRQSTEIKLKKSNVRISPLTKKLFGIEGVLSSKNFKRNKRKYRITVFSLFVSVVLFISASSLSSYFTSVVEFETIETIYDISIGFEDLSERYEKEIIDKIKALDSVDETYFEKYTYNNSYFDISLLSDGFFEYLEFLGFTDIPEYYADESYRIHFLEDETFKKLLKDNRLKEEDYFNKSSPTALLFDETRWSYTDENNKTYNGTYAFFNEDIFPCQIASTHIYSNLSEIEGYEQYTDYFCYDADGKRESFVYKKLDGEEGYDESAEPVILSADKATEEYKINVGYVLKDNPPFFPGGRIEFIYPESMKEYTDFAQLNSEQYSTGYLLAQDPAAAYADIEKVAKEYYSYGTISLNNQAEETEIMRAVVIIAKVLAYGFIVLISLIAAANVFNTISTNIALRQREIATLQSVGLGKKGLRKMMLFESLLYGIKSLIFSLPVSLAITYLIYLVVSDGGYDMGFYLPVGNFIIAILSVFVIVFASMVYSIKKIEKNNVVDTLRSENI